MQQSSGEIGKFLKFVVILCCQDVWCVKGDFLKGHGSITHALTHHYRIYEFMQEGPSLDDHESPPEPQLFSGQ